jgi:hypothetical protein
VSDPVLPLYLNRRETEVLKVAVEVLLQMDGAAVHDQELQRSAEKQLEEREGPGAVARLDRALSAARERVPVLRRLHTALVEHEQGLERARKTD